MNTHFKTWMEARERSPEQQAELDAIMHDAMMWADLKSKAGWTQEDFRLAFGLSMMGVPPEQATHMIERIRNGDKVGLGMRW